MFWILTRFTAVGLLSVALLVTAAAISFSQDATGRPDLYEITLKKIEFSTDNGTTWTTLKEADLTFNLTDINAGAIAGRYISGGTLPVGTYNRVRVTVGCTMRLQGTLTNGGVTYSTTAAGATCANPPTACAAAVPANFTAPAAICPAGTMQMTSPAGAIQFTVEEGKAITVAVDLNTNQALALFGTNLLPGQVNGDMSIQ